VANDKQCPPKCEPDSSGKGSSSVSNDKQCPPKCEPDPSAKGTSSVTNDKQCPPPPPTDPAVSVSATCNTTTGVGTAHLVVKNTATTAQTIKVSVGGTTTTLVVAGGQVGTVDRAFGAGSPPTFTVSDAALDFTTTVSVTDFTCVVSTVVTPPTTTITAVTPEIETEAVQAAEAETAPLPATGADPRPLGEGGVALVLAGAAMVRTATWRRRPRARRA
jgi:hypothetical protein